MNTIVQTLKSLPEPGVDVFIESQRYPGKLVLARLEQAGHFFSLAVFPGRGQQRGRAAVSVDAVIRWDYATPAGDWLC